MLCESNYCEDLQNERRLLRLESFFDVFKATNTENFKQIELDTSKSYKVNIQLLKNEITISKKNQVTV